MTDYRTMYECAAEFARSLILEANSKDEEIRRLEAEIRELKEQAEELRFNPNHDPENGRFTSGNGVDKSSGSGIIKNEIDKGNISLEINHEKQSRHIKGSSEYVEGRSYLIISEDEAQSIINEKSCTGIPVLDRKGNWKNKELIGCDRVIGVNVDETTRKEENTDKGTIHYSKSGTHLVPRKER